VKEGFLAINEYLQSANGPGNVFAVGDVATSVVDPRPKAGVFAVRQGLPLADNLRRHLLGQPLRAFHPQRTWLSLVSTGDQSAIASKGWFVLSGPWLWQWKDCIDRAFMAKFSSELPIMDSTPGMALSSTYNIVLDCTERDTSGMTSAWTGATCCTKTAADLSLCWQGAVASRVCCVRVSFSAEPHLCRAPTPSLA
jgi:selenide, water dikinase